MALPRIVSIVFFLAASMLAAQSREAIVLDLRTYPPDATVFSALGPTFSTGGRPLVSRSLEGGRREFRIESASPAVLVRAPGYRDRVLFLDGEEGRVTVDLRLEREQGPLSLLAEVPTGGSPKSALFLGAREVVVPLLRDGGADRFLIEEERIERAGRLEPPAEWAEADGFVEPLYIADRGELFVSQMTTDAVHVFDTASGRYLRTVRSGGRWPKVLVADVAGRYLWVSNWITESVAQIDLESGTVVREIPVSGVPRGLALTDNGRLLWVCIFSTGDIELFDTRTGLREGLIDLPQGAARHIVADSAAVSGDGGRLYFSDMYHGSVGIIDAASRRVLVSRRLGSNLNTIALDPRGRYLFASERGRNNPESYLLPGPQFGRIFVLDADTLDIVQVVWGRNQPTGLAVSPDGRYLAATDFLDDNLAVYRVAE